MLHRGAYSVPHLRGRIRSCKPVGVGINVLPHASRELCGLGLEDALTSVAVITREFCFYNRYGQLHLQRARRSLRRIRIAAVLDTPRRPADGAARCVPLARGRRSRRDGLALHTSRCGRTGVARTSRAPRRESRSKRSAETSWSAAKASIPSCASSSIRDEGPPELLRHQHVARRHALAAASSPAPA